MSNISNNIFIGGTGQVASALGRLIKQANIPINGVVSRSLTSAEGLAGQLGTVAFTWDQLDIQDGDCLILAVKDDALVALVDQLPRTNAFVFHCAGAAPTTALSKLGSNTGVIYPLQSLRKDIRLPARIPFLLTCSSQVAEEMAEQLVRAMQCPFLHVTDEQRLRYHLAAVLVNNLTNHLFNLADEFCAHEQLDFQQLLPLIQETTARLEFAAPGKLQTGPAVRGDEQTRQAHERLLAAYPDLLKWYTLSWEQIRKRVTTETGTRYP